MDSISSDIASLTAKTEPYTATASIKDGVVDSSSSAVTGDRTTDLFSTAESGMGKDDFLMLLVTQLRYQDPLNPMENTEFVSQLAQFRALENGTNMETSIEKLNDSFQGTVEAQKFSAQSITNTSAVSLIGKQVCLRRNTVDWYAKTGEEEPIRIHLGDANSATVEILDEDGNVVSTLNATDKDSQNSANLVWNGIMDNGQIASSGQYTIHIVGEEQNLSLYAFAQDVVSGVRFSSDGAMLKVDGSEFSISNVMDVSTDGNGSSGLDSLSPSTVVSLLGKQVRVYQNAFKYDQLDGESESVNINAGVNEKVRVDLTDTDGNVVYTTYVYTDGLGKGELTWSGQTGSGSFAPAGMYRINIEGDQADPNVYAYQDGVVDGITNLGGVSQLRVNGRVVDLGDIIDIAAPVTDEENGV